MADFLTGMRISSSGMAAQRMRMNTIASNIANINTTQTPEGGPYRRKDVVFEAMPDAKNFGEIISSTDPAGSFQRVQVTDVISDRKAPLLKYEPDHPDANADGYVAYPNINLMEEMTNMIQASRSYEANVTAVQASKDMALSALEIGR
ncbi:flagellar basal body rod protein FlgC [Bdellovibrio bacteriovorus]|uniref:Flagellar basal-body rod protein FlgC n=1 Tax=Bdellovibrio bacteriovorus (strain ATCC 15356 / DSM 50701 / NCIMB 9529 / HD100) TaxID=264462 RepID=Q6MHX8_BDEBA|nr:flagellar basal body rod protein FlgC [Bdellovibrio bacteriovorus]AHZ83765.1 flagellar basal body rod protein FlgC [Bdellovibrio bacteriovorus]BEV69738.1 Flagellar basal-body rod protein FlgC [Bdellovibrio bacteriovorus]CAE78204.1 flagellar basal-body rod protein [Bdellovibrio bacteriovorus HD100]